MFVILIFLNYGFFLFSDNIGYYQNYLLKISCDIIRDFDYKNYKCKKLINYN